MQNSYSVYNPKYFSFSSGTILFDSLLEACYHADVPVLKLYDQNQKLTLELNDYSDLGFLSFWLTEHIGLDGLIDNFMWDFFKDVPQENIVMAYSVCDISENHYLMFSENHSNLRNFRKELVKLSQENLPDVFNKYYLLLLLKVDNFLSRLENKNDRLTAIKFCGLVKYFILSEFKYRDFMVKMENNLLKILLSEINSEMLRYKNAKVSNH